MINNNFPKQIAGEFIFKKEISVPGANYIFAEYKDKTGKSYFGKFWFNNLGSSKKRYLINEINALNYLKKYHVTTPNTSTFPDLKSSLVSKTLCFYLSTFIKGKNPSTQEASVQIGYLEKSINLLHSVKINDTQRNGIMIRKPTYYIISFPFLFAKSLINYPQNYFLFTKSLFTFYLNAPGIYKQGLIFTHRDLKPGNLLVQNNKIYIVDFQLFALTVPEFEYASIVRSIIRNNKLTNGFMSLLYSKYLNTKNSRKSFKAMLIYYSMMGLIDKKFPIKRTEDFINTLKFAKSIMP